MTSINKVILIGNLTADPELRSTPQGTAVTDLRLALNRSWKSENGERREETTFVDATVWGRQAETACQFLGKGHPVYLEGRLQLETWQDKGTGENRQKLKIVAERVQFLPSRDGREGGTSGANRNGPASGVSGASVGSGVGSGGSHLNHLASSSVEEPSALA